MRITYELDKIDSAILSGMVMTKRSPNLSFAEIKSLTQLVLVSDFKFEALLDAIMSGSLWGGRVGPVATSDQISRALETLIALRLVVQTSNQQSAKADTGQQMTRSVTSPLLRWLRGLPPLQPNRTAKAGERNVRTYSFSLTDEGRGIGESIIAGRRPQLRPPQEYRQTVFVASAVGNDEIDRLFESVLAPACAAVDLTPIRVDMTEPAETITTRVLEGIRDCRCLLADLTFARQSVYFEIGVAHGMGIPIVLTCRQDHFRATDDASRVHFDLEQYKISFWHTSDSGGFVWPTRMHPTDRLRMVLSNHGYSLAIQTA